MDSLGTNPLRLEVILVDTFLSCLFKGHKAPAIFDCADQEAYSVIIRMYCVFYSMLEYIYTTHVSYFVC